MEDQLSALGLVLNCTVLWNTAYIDRALAELRRQGYPVLTEDVPRLSPFVRRHISIDGHYAEGHRRALQLPPARPRWHPRPLRDPDAEDDE